MKRGFLRLVSINPIPIEQNEDRIPLKTMKYSMKTVCGPFALIRQLEAREVYSTLLQALDTKDLETKFEDLAIRSTLVSERLVRKEHLEAGEAISVHKAANVAAQVNPGYKPG